MATSDLGEAPDPIPGRSILITGGRRVGGELALLLADRGWNVAMTYHTSREAIGRTIAAVKERGREGLAVPADLSQPEQAASAVHRAARHFDRLDALVNMASVYRRTPMSTLTPRDFDEMIAANLAAPYHTAIAAARIMREQPGQDGIKRPYKDYLPYLVAKGGLTTMTLALATELAPHIAVAMIQPAMIEPPPELSELDKQAVLAQTPLHRSGSPSDVNRLIVYLLEGTNFVTGACFRVDGGRFLGVEE
jgi:pteridine reductase